MAYSKDPIERGYIPAEQWQIRLEQYHRYVIVMDIVKGKDVLDVASGEGYGSMFMAEAARSVVGVDISAENVQYASATYTKPNLRFCQGSATHLNFADASFDVVVSFDTIGHLDGQAQILTEIRRVLRPDGVLVISNTNPSGSTEKGVDHNDVPTNALGYSEFDELLRVQFPAIRYFGQRLLMGSVIQPLEGGQSSLRVWHDDGKALKPNATHLEEPCYFVAVCTANNTNLPSIEMSILYPEKLDLVKYYTGFTKNAVGTAVAEYETHFNYLKRIIAVREEQIGNLDEMIANRDEMIANRDEIIANRNEQIEAIFNSTSWLVTRPLRGIKTFVAPPRLELPKEELVIPLKEQHDTPPPKPGLGSIYYEQDQKNQERNLVLLHHHIFKNAGTTIEGILKDNFGNNFGKLETDSSTGKVTPEILESFLGEQKNIKAISSHQFHCQEFKLKLYMFLDIILLRHPLDRLRSVYDFYHFNDTLLNDPLVESAKNMSLGAFLGHLLEHYPNQVNDVQVNLLSLHGNYRPPNQYDFSVAYARIRNAFITGTVELINESLVLAEFFLCPDFGKLDFSYKAQNVKADRKLGLENRLKEMQAECGTRLYNQLIKANQLDIRLLDCVKHELYRRIKLIPDYDNKLSKFKDRCIAKIT